MLVEFVNCMVSREGEESLRDCAALACIAQSIFGYESHELRHRVFLSHLSGSLGGQIEQAAKRKKLPPYVSGAVLEIYLQN